MICVLYSTRYNIYHSLSQLTFSFMLLLQLTYAKVLKLYFTLLTEMTRHAWTNNVPLNISWQVWNINTYLALLTLTLHLYYDAPSNQLCCIWLNLSRQHILIHFRMHLAASVHQCITLLHLVSSPHSGIGWSHFQPSKECFSRSGLAF